MPRRSQLPRPALSTAPGGRRPASGRDPITRLLLFSQLMALGMVAAAFYLRFPNDFHRPGTPEITLDRFPALLDKAVFIAAHTRTAWVTLAVLSTLVSSMAYLRRQAARRSTWVTYSPAAVVLVIALHAGAQARLQSQGPLEFEFRGPAPAGLDDALRNLPPGTATAPQPASAPVIHAVTITRLTVPEGSAAQWQLLLAGDALFSVPLLMAWMLSFARQGTPRPPMGS